MAHATGIVWGLLLISGVYRLHVDAELPAAMRHTSLEQSIEESKTIAFISLLHLVGWFRLPPQTLHPERGLLSSIMLVCNAVLLRTGSSNLLYPSSSVREMSPSIAAASSQDERSLLELVVLFIGCYECVVQFLMLSALWFGTCGLDLSLKDTLPPICRYCKGGSQSRGRLGPDAACDHIPL